MKGRAFPLHRDSWSPVQLWAHPVGIVLACLVGTVGLMSALSIARVDTRRDEATVAAVAAVAVAAGVYFLGRRLSWLRPEHGLVVVHPDHLVIHDTSLLDGPVVLPRDAVVDIFQLTPVTPPPRPGTLRADGVVGLVGTGDDWPNTEIWVSRPVVLPAALLVRSRDVTRVQLRTPGVGALLRWIHPPTPLLPGSPERLPALMTRASWQRYRRPYVEVRRDGSLCFTEVPTDGID